jgi:hypothetical protein
MVVNWCSMCKKSGEFIDHLLLHCEVARELWTSIFSLFGVEWVMPRSGNRIALFWTFGGCPFYA